MARRAGAVYRAGMASAPGNSFSGWRELIWAGLAVLCAVLTYYACQTPEPTRTALELAAAACDATPGQQRELLEHFVAPDVEIEIADSGVEIRSRTELASRLAELRGMRGRGFRCQVELRDVRVEPASGGGAWIEATLQWSDSQPSDLHARPRPLRALFRESKGPAGDTVQRLERASVGPALRSEPEARP